MEDWFLQKIDYTHIVIMILYYFDNSSIHKRTRFYVIIKYIPVL